MFAHGDWNVRVSGFASKAMGEWRHPNITQQHCLSAMLLPSNPCLNACSVGLLNKEGVVGWISGSAGTPSLATGSFCWSHPGDGSGAPLSQPCCLTQPFQLPTAPAGLSLGEALLLQGDLVSSRTLVLSPSSASWDHCPSLTVTTTALDPAGGALPWAGPRLPHDRISSALCWNEFQISLWGVDGRSPNPAAGQELKRFTCLLRSDGSISLWMCQGGVS